MYVHYRKEFGKKDEFDGIIGTYLDDLLCCGTEELKRCSDRLRDVIQL